MMKKKLLNAYAEANAYQETTKFKGLKTSHDQLTKDIQSLMKERRVLVRQMLTQLENYER